MHPAIALALAYLSGSIPFALLAGKANSIDLRKQGSGNLGATNVFRTLGRSLPRPDSARGRPRTPAGRRPTNGGNTS